jgi:hypothetical protein
MTKVFMRKMFDSSYTKEKFTNGKYTITEWHQVYENNDLDEDIYIDDKFHHAECWGSCYDESDLKDIINRRKKNESNKEIRI